MIDGQTFLAVIPARAGSKRCPGKNIRPFRGKPLILWAIEEAKKSKYIDRLIFSSDCPKMLNLAADHCEINRRPDELAGDDVLNEEVLRALVAERLFDWVVLLQPTSPLRTVEDIDACIERAQMGEACVSYNRETGCKNGAVYVAKREWIERHNFSHLGTMRYLMPEERSLDIDYAEQFLQST